MIEQLTRKNNSFFSLHLSSINRLYPYFKLIHSLFAYSIIFGLYIFKHLLYISLDISLFSDYRHIYETLSRHRPPFYDDVTISSEKEFKLNAQP